LGAFGEKLGALGEKLGALGEKLGWARPAATRTIPVPAGDWAPCYPQPVHRFWFGEKLGGPAATVSF
jgi:hypothetical protein